MRITSTGQVTIPADVREKAGLFPDISVQCVFDGEGVRIIKSDPQPMPNRGAQIIAHLRGRGDQPLSTDEIMTSTRED